MGCFWCVRRPELGNEKYTIKTYHAKLVLGVLWGVFVVDNEVVKWGTKEFEENVHNCLFIKMEILGEEICGKKSHRTVFSSNIQIPSKAIFFIKNLHN